MRKIFSTILIMVLLIFLFPSSGVYSQDEIIWHSSNTGLSSKYVWNVVIDPLTPSTLYVSTSGGLGRVSKSVNGGASWSPCDTGIIGTPVNALAIDPQTPTTLYAALYDEGLFKSVNGGATWRSSNIGLTELDVETIVIDPKTPSKFSAGLVGGLV